MSALADALVAAQRRALTALEKAYVAEKIDPMLLAAHLDRLGLNDGVDQDRLVYALDLIRTLGAALPSEPAAGDGEKPMREKVTDAQLNLIGKLFREKSIAPLPDPDLTALSKQDAHKLIDQLKAGTYNAAEWEIPF